MFAFVLANAAVVLPQLFFVNSQCTWAVLHLETNLVCSTVAIGSLFPEKAFNTRSVGSIFISCCNIMFLICEAFSHLLRLPKGHANDIY